ncbi:MAG: glycosyltransferase [Acidobacteria bacterium]|nr:glycosyltransferase [Acidobacteriota bacterium]
MPEVSVIIPAYNAAAYLAAAIDSVLGQTCQDFELLIVDDGSTDATPDIARSYGTRVRHVRQPKSGVAAARNRGISESRGPWVAFLDADDAWLAPKLELQHAAVSGGNARACYTARIVTDAELRPCVVEGGPAGASMLEALLFSGNIVSTPSSVMCDRALVSDLGGFDVTLSYTADWDLWVRLAAHTEFVYVDQALVRYRRHAESMSRDVRLLERDSIRTLDKAFDSPSLPDRLRPRRRRALARNYMVLAGSYFHAGAYADFARCAARALTLDVHQMTYLAAFPVRRIRQLRTPRARTHTLTP